VTSNHTGPRWSAEMITIVNDSALNRPLIHVRSSLSRSPLRATSADEAPPTWAAEDVAPGRRGRGCRPVMRRPARGRVAHALRSLVLRPVPSLRNRTSLRSPQILRPAVAGGRPGCSSKTRQAGGRPPRLGEAVRKKQDHERIRTRPAGPRGLGLLPADSFGPATFGD